MGTLGKVLVAGIIAVGLTGSTVAFAAANHARSTGRAGSMMSNGSMMNGSMMNGSMMNRSMMNGGSWSDASGPATIDGARAVTVTTDELRFSPATILATVNEALNMTVRNNDEVAHDFTLPMLGIHAVVPAGQSVTFGVGAPRAGTYPFWCSVAGHAQAGMTGTLVVSE